MVIILIWQSLILGKKVTKWIYSPNNSATFYYQLGFYFGLCILPPRMYYLSVKKITLDVASDISIN